MIFNQAIVESIEHLKDWLAWVTPIPSADESELSCRQGYARFLMNEDLMAFFILKSSGKLVGGGGLHYVHWGLRRFELGYWGRTNCLGDGLITEAVEALVQYAMKTLHANRLFLTTDERNLASQRLAERAGFEFEGTLRQDRNNAQSKLRNTRVYSVIRADVQ